MQAFSVQSFSLTTAAKSICERTYALRYIKCLQQNVCNPMFPVPCSLFPVPISLNP
ncbi:MAG: hypothetical protein F6J90_12880 [Moorea sp. SIOASIH]|uniref:hypothetical protein n=1 Tax=Moorena sp. SIOASIH TaxID=2607817 RepID=UPI0013BA6672|nr:hypothetical protein [Moorena sp. SIOASIH]NEO37161.1 hypothetical protein [Moorena sp. SIOASIH]